MIKFNQLKTFYFNILIKAQLGSQVRQFFLVSTANNNEHDQHYFYLSLFYQTIFRLISDRTVEENILKKAQQKRMLCNMAIEGGNFTTAFFKEDSVRDLFNVEEQQKLEEEKQQLKEKEEKQQLKEEENISQKHDNDENKQQNENDFTNEDYEKVFQNFLKSVQCYFLQFVSQKY